MTDRTEAEALTESVPGEPLAREESAVHATSTVKQPVKVTSGVPVTSAGATRDAGPTTAAARGAGAREVRGDKPRSIWRELPVLIVVAVGLALLIKTFFLQAFFIPSGSMEKTLAIGDRVLVNKLVYDFRDPHRGEIVVFNGKGNGFQNAGETTIAAPGNQVGRALRNVQSFLGLGSFNESDFIKRVIAVGGDTVSCPADPGGTGRCSHVVVNGHPLDEAGYLYEDNVQVFAPMKVPSGQLFVMGDHRGNSADSRVHGFVPVGAVIGRAFVTVWPVASFSGHPVPGTFDQQPLAPSAFRPPLAAPAAGGAAVPPVAGLVLATPLVVGRRRLRRRSARRRAGPSRQAPTTHA